EGLDGELLAGPWRARLLRRLLRRAYEPLTGPQPRSRTSDRRRTRDSVLGGQRLLPRHLRAVLGRLLLCTAERPTNPGLFGVAQAHESVVLSGPARAAGPQTPDLPGSPESRIVRSCYPLRRLRICRRL